ncbi:hypothetical protein BU17DRAFT_80330 [Hysterangium stoloniferum]|nr:hypothetical protein BU17DRAFT_80330 [Hysterangium stoloniferum]
MSSISKPMSWLRTSHNNHNSSNANNHTVNISEPKLVHDMFTSSGPATYTHTRYGTLGTGATVVRTPQDALARAMLIQTQPYPPQEHPGSIRPEDDDASSYEEDEPPSPGSPPLPPIRYASKSSPNLPVLSEMGEIIDDPASTLRGKPTPTRAIPNTPEQVTRSSVVKSSPASPVLPLNVTSTPPQPPFAPILLSPAPDVLLDLSTLMVTLETSTASLRTTYATLTSRSSHLADYLHSIAREVHEREKRKFRDTLLEEEEDDDGDVLNDPDTPFASLFAAHLTSVGLLPHSTGMIHMFLDRPSTPYTHILTYLRSPTSSLATLPRAARTDMETLLELRDEAKYLGLDELHRLCCDEVRQTLARNSVHSPQIQTPTHVRANSGNGQVLYMPSERGRDGVVRLREIVPGRLNNDGDRHSGTSTESCKTGSRSRSRGPPKSAEGWI